MINLAKPVGNDVSVHLPAVSAVNPKQQHWQPLKMRWKSEQIIASPYRAESPVGSERERAADDSYSSVVVQRIQFSRYEITQIFHGGK